LLIREKKYGGPMRKYSGHMGKYGQNIMVNIIPRTYGKMHRTYGKMKKYRKNIEKIHLGHMGKNGGHMATDPILYGQFFSKKKKLIFKINF
jgi:hypothetical protein